MPCHLFGIIPVGAKVLSKFSYGLANEAVTRFKEDWIDGMFAPVVGQT
jgi:hypothetical protein